MKKSIVHKHISGRQVRPFALDATAAAITAALAHLPAYGISMDAADIRAMHAFVQDAGDIPTGLGGLTTPSVATPIQFLQAWLPGFVQIATAPRLIDELIGVTTVGSWEDEEVVQGVLESTGDAVPYTDHGNVPLSNWNANFERRSIVRFEKGFEVGRLEEARSARMRISTAAEKRNAATLALEIARNRVGFYGYNDGANRTFGFLNDPNLPAYYTLPNGAGGSPAWSSKTFLEITADIRHMFAQLRAQSRGLIDPEKMETTLALPVSAVDYLSVTSQYGNSVRQWLRETYPRCRVISVPELDGANGGVNAGYLYAETVQDGGSDNNRVFDQLVPAKFQTLGVEQRSKTYLEDFANATAGVMLKRPFAVFRATGM